MKRTPSTSSQPPARHAIHLGRIAGGPAQTSAPVVGAERVRAFIRSRFNPIRSLTPELLAQYLDSFKTGYFRQAALIWDAIEERDDTLASVAHKRKAAAARYGWEVLTLDAIAESQKAEAEKHKAALEAFYNNLTVTNAIDENERGEVSLLVRQMMDAVGKRYAVHEIVWKPLVGRDLASTPLTPSDNPQALLTAELRFVPLWFFENTTGKLRYIQSEGAIEGVAMDEESWLISVGQGLMTACSVAYIYKTMSLKDWVIYNERHGMPGIHGKTDAAEGSDEWDTLVDAVQNFAADWALVTNTGATIDKLDMAATGQLPYPPLVERMDRALAALWRGADLSTISAGQGQGQGASLQGDEAKVLEEDDAAWLSENLSRQLDRRVIEYVFGAGVQPLAYIKIKTAQKKDITQDILIDRFLLDSGAPLSIEDTLERYNRPLPDADENLLKAPASIASRDISRPDVKTGPLLPGSAGTLSNERVQDGTIAAAVAETIGVRSEWLQPFFSALEAKAQNGSLTDAELLDAIEAMAKALPELMTDRAVQDTAAIVQKSLAAALISGLAESPGASNAAPSSPRIARGMRRS